MPCYYPIDGWRSKEPNENGRYPIVFTRPEAQQDEPIKLPCGRCIGCRLENSRQWAMRCVHEASLHTENCYITLTYNDENLPAYGTLTRREWQLFMKKLRKKLHPRKIRFKMCGEYGNPAPHEEAYRNVGRPHFHALIFGWEPKDQKFHSEFNGNRLNTSKLLEDVWGKGFVTVGAVTFESAAYVARYVMKKINGDDADDHYATVDIETGELRQLMPEFTGQSMRPGIGYDWYKKYKGDLDKGFITLRGIKMAPPKYYDSHYKSDDEEKHMFIARKRYEAIDILDPDMTLDRLRVKEEVKRIRTKSLERSL